MRSAFANSLRREEVDGIIFSDIAAETLGEATFRVPLVLTPLLVAGNMAGRPMSATYGSAISIRIIPT